VSGSLVASDEGKLGRSGPVSLVGVEISVADTSEEYLVEKGSKREFERGNGNPEG